MLELFDQLYSCEWVQVDRQLLPHIIYRQIRLTHKYIYIYKVVSLAIQALQQNYCHALSVTVTVIVTIRASHCGSRLQHAAGAASMREFNNHNTIKLQRSPIWLLLKRASKLSFGVDYIKLNLERICNLRSDVEEMRIELCEYHWAI